MRMPEPDAKMLSRRAEIVEGQGILFSQPLYELIELIEEDIDYFHRGLEIGRATANINFTSLHILRTGHNHG